MEKTFILKAENGLHARPATNFVKFVSTLSANVYLIDKGFVADAKSIMAILSLGLSKGTEFIIRVEPDDEEILNKVENYLKEKEMI
jgi:phosphocarrier protein HPr